LRGAMLPRRLNDPSDANAQYLFEFIDDPIKAVS
jgi:hypothetical protein